MEDHTKPFAELDERVRSPRRFVLLWAASLIACLVGLAFLLGVLKTFLIIAVGLLCLYLCRRFEHKMYD